jgi:hypothetical protein
MVRWAEEETVTEIIITLSKNPTELVEEESLGKQNARVAFFLPDFVETGCGLCSEVVWERSEVGGRNIRSGCDLGNREECFQR